MAVFATDVKTESIRNSGSADSSEAYTASENRVAGIRRGRSTETPTVFGAAAKSVEFSDRLRNHQRETRRLVCEIPCSVELVLMDGTPYDTGIAVLRNISPSGALVSSFELDRGNFPAELFKVRMVLKGETYAGIGIEATPVRFAMGTHGLGVKFDEIFVTA